jgi:LCP family protein required for cell wall assembly
MSGSTSGQSSGLVVATRATIIAVLVLAAAWSAWLAVSLASLGGNDSTQTTRLRESLRPPSGSQRVTYLLVGVDASTGGEPRADTLVVVQLDARASRVWIVSIPRDTRVQVSGHGFVKINAARALGGPALTVRTVADFLGVPVNHYAEVDWAGFQRLVDDLGGVWLDVPQSLDDRKAATHSVDGSAASIDAGYQRLDGEHALTFVRSRQALDADFSRMRNQQMMLQALARQATRPTNAARAPWFLGNLSRYVVTDMTPWQVFAALASVAVVPSGGIQKATVPGDWREPFVWPDEKAKVAIADALRSGRDFDAQASGFSVTVADGSGVPGAGADVAGRLERAGFRVERRGRVPESYTETAVVCRKADRADAQRAAAALGGVEVIDGGDRYNYTTRFLVLVGSEWGKRSP